MTAQKNYICLVCRIVGLLDNIYKHVFEEHIKKWAPLQCSCGFVRGTEKGLRRHQRNAGCHGPFLRELPGVKLEEYLRKATQAECARAWREAPERQGVAQQNEATVTNEAAERNDAEQLDFNDWMIVAEEQRLTTTTATQTDIEESAQPTSLADSFQETLKRQNLRLLEDNNQLVAQLDRLNKQLAEQKRINEALSAEVCQPAMGIASDAALHGLEDAWRRSEEEMANHSGAPLFPEPPKRLESTIHIPATNTRLRRTEKIWKRACEDAGESYSKRHRY